MNTVEALVARADAVSTLVHSPAPDDWYATLPVALRQASVNVHKHSLRGPAQFVVANGQTLEACEKDLGLVKDSSGLTDPNEDPQFGDAKLVGRVPALGLLVYASGSAPRGVFLLGRVSEGLAYEFEPATDGNEPSVRMKFSKAERGSIRHFARVEVPALQVSR